jgi:hypothetical protein
MDEDSFCKTAKSRRENVGSRIIVTIMDRSANAALPLSYSKTFPALRAGAAFTLATGLGGKRFVDFIEPHACVSASIPKHGSERTPPCIQNRLCLSGFGEGGGIRVADEDCTVAFDQLGAQIVQEVLPPIRDLGVNRSGTGSLSRIMPTGGLSRPQLKVPQTEAIPQRQPSSGEVNLAAVIADRTDLERDPAQGAPRAAAFAPRKSDLSVLAAPQSPHVEPLRNGQKSNPDRNRRSRSNTFIDWSKHE